MGSNTAGSSFASTGATAARSPGMDRKNKPAMTMQMTPLAVNVTVVKLEEAVQGYKDFDKGAAKKFVLDPHGSIAA